MQARPSSLGVLGAAIAALGWLGCPERALAPPEGDLGPRDLAGLDLGVDLAVPDLALPPDLATDLAINPCPAGTEFIYTIDSDTTLSRFNPLTNQFFDVGPISCPTSDTPNSMAIDRDGDGWVNYHSGDIFRLSTRNAVCTASGYPAGQGGLTSVGMSFAQDSPGGSDETLFITDSFAGSRLASVDLMSLQLTSVLTIEGGGNPELTGDDEANLWGFFPSASSPRIARIDKQAGTVDRVIPLPTLSGEPRAWGVAHFQGAFYVFLQRDFEPSTQIYRVDAATGAVTTAAANTGREIVGVGVATCAGNGSDLGAP